MDALQSFISWLFAKRHALSKKKMAEQSILNGIQDDWATEIDPRQLATMALQARHSIICGFAEQLNIAPSNNLDTLVAKIAKAHNISLKQELAALEVTCIQAAKIDLFVERYGHLFEMDENGDLSYSIPMMRKITGFPLPG
ncbi:MAG: hypothetical protein ACOYNF_01675 [Rhodoferax sp.]